MNKIPQCDRCQFNAKSNYLVCAVHPDGVQGDRCPDFSLDPNFVEMWSPIGFMFIDEQLVRKPIVYPVDFQPTLERSQQWEILDNHPYFTGVYPQCGNSYPQNIGDRCFLAGMRSLNRYTVYIIYTTLSIILHNSMFDSI